MPTILIADDYEANRRVLGKLLTREGYTVVDAADGASALEQARAEHPDVALVDLLMPVLDGFEFVHRLREEGGPVARMPVVFITAAYVLSEVMALARSCGVTQVLGRPASFEETLGAIEQAMREAPQAVVPPPRAEFRLELLRVLTSSLSDHLRTVIPTLAECVENGALSEHQGCESDPPPGHPADLPAGSPPQTPAATDVVL